MISDTEDTKHLTPAIPSYLGLFSNELEGRKYTYAMDILQLDIVKKFEDMLKANFSLVNHKNERLYGDKMCKGNQG